MNGDLFADIAADLHEIRTSPERTLDRIVEWAGRAVESTDAGIMLVHPRGKIETAAPTSERVAKAHDLQVQFDEGPCLDVIQRDDVDSFVTGDASSDPRFPNWGREVAQLGYHSVISVVLATSERKYGSLNIYSDQVRAFDRDDLAVVEIFGRHAAIALAIADESHGKDVALDTRKLIGQAQGILMERFDIDGDRAFDFLRRQSQDHNIKLRAVADWVVHNRGKNDIRGIGSAQLPA